MTHRRWIFGGLILFIIVAAIVTIGVIVANGGDNRMSGTTGDQAMHATTSYASITATPESGSAPLVVSLRAIDYAHGMLGAVTKYSWDFGDGAKAEGLTAEHTYTQTGKYTVILTIFYQDGPQQVDRKTIVVK